MTIAFVSTMGGVPWAGSEELWADAAMELRNRGAEVHTHGRWFPTFPKKLQQLQQAGCHVFRYRPPSGLVRRAGRLLRTDANQQMHRWLDRVRPELVVISQSCQDGVRWGDACRNRGLRYCFVTQVVAEFFWPSDEASEFAASVMLDAERCYFVSKNNLELTQRQLATKLPNASVVWNPFTVPLDNQLGWPAAPPIRLACVARLDPRHKGQDILLECLARPEWNGRSVQLSLFGVGGNEGGLRKLANTLGLSNVTFHGQTDSILDVWREHHALVLASRVEGMPLAAIEAMACSRPCVVTDVGGNAELVCDGKSGFVSKAPSVTEFAYAMERMWESRDRLSAMGLCARAAIEARVPPDPGVAFADELETLAA